MTFKELEWKKVKELLSPYMEFKLKDTWITGSFNSYTLFTHFGKNMSVHYISNINDLDWDWTYQTCKSYFDVLRLLPKIKETFLELKHPGYHEKLKRIQDDC